MALLEGAVVIAWWYACSVVNNLWTKKLMQVDGFRFPYLVAFLGMLAQLAVLVATVKAEGGSLPRRKKLLKRWRVLLPVAVAGILGGVFHKLALLHTSIPVVHTVKSLTVVATAIFGYIATGAKWPSEFAILLMVFGVAYALLTSSNFSHPSEYRGVMYAGVCVVSDAMKTVVGKFLVKRNPIRSLVGVQAVSIAIFTPLVLFNEVPPLLAYLSEKPVPWSALCLSVFGVAGMELGSYYTLSLVSPVTHAMANGLRSLTVIAAGVAFGAEVGPRFAFGSVLAVSGVLLHSYKSAKKAAKRD